MRIEAVNPDEIEGPINVVPEVWVDEKMHELAADWSEDPCWCEPRIEGKYLHHRSVFHTLDPEDQGY